MYHRLPNLVDGSRRWLSSTNSITSITSITSNTNSNTINVWNENISKRDWADLEDFLCRTVGEKVHDPVLQQPLARLKWLHKQIAVSHADSVTLQLLLRLPSLLHPALEQLKAQICHAADAAVQQWLRENNKPALWLADGGCKVCVNVEAVATTPVPMMARLVEDHEDVIQSLGPGLKAVAHFVAVYSCKVRGTRHALDIRFRNRTLDATLDATIDG